MPIGGLHHVKVDVSDLERSLAFYCDVLGYEQIVRYDRDDGVTIVQVGPEGRPPGLELWHEPPHVGYGQDRIHFALVVTDLAAVLAYLAAMGVHPTDGPLCMDEERIAFVRDPDGYRIELYELT